MTNIRSGDDSYEKEKKHRSGLWFEKCLIGIAIITLMVRIHCTPWASGAPPMQALTSFTGGLPTAQEHLDQEVICNFPKEEMQSTKMSLNVCFYRICQFKIHLVLIGVVASYTYDYNQIILSLSYPAKFKWYIIWIMQNLNYAKLEWYKIWIMQNRNDAQMELSKIGILQ